jgi:hypothetical protein
MAVGLCFREQPKGVPRLGWPGRVGPPLAGADAVGKGGDRD